MGVNFIRLLGKGRLRRIRRTQQIEIYGGIKRKKKYIIGVLLGFLIVLLAVPLGNTFGFLFLTIGKNIEKYNMQLERIIVSFQIVGGILSGLSGLAFILSNEKE